MQKRTTYLALLDAQKAFDLVWHDGLFKKLSDLGIHTSHLSVLQEFYKESSSSVLWNKRSGPPFEILQGVKQGSVLSPTLYTVFIDGLIKALREARLGCSFYGRYTGVLVLADDVALISTSPQDLQDMLDLTLAYSNTWRYKINPKKSAVIVINKKPSSNSVSEWHMGDFTMKESSRHPHLGIIKSGSRIDPTIDMISRGYKTFFSLTGTKQSAQRLTPSLCEHLWKVYCIPRMMYGIQVHCLTGYMVKRLNRAQTYLFKRVLGLPKTAADEAPYLLLDILPLNRHIHMEILLVIGQLTCLSADRIERRILLHAVANNTPLIRHWGKIIDSYQLPTLPSLLGNHISYSEWKKLIRHAISKQHYEDLVEAVSKKSTLSFWSGRIPRDKNNLYPKQISNPLLREAVTIRAQLSCQTYLTKERLFTLHQSTSKTCELCKTANEDVTHFIGECHILSHHRMTLQNAIAEEKDLSVVSKHFIVSNPTQFTLSVLILPEVSLSTPARNTLNLFILKFLHKMHLSRSTLMSIQS